MAVAVVVARHFFFPMIILLIPAGERSEPAVTHGRRHS